MTDPLSPARALSAAGALFFDPLGRVLLVEPTYKDHWEIPGGMIEAGEMPREACVREISEELGLVMTPGMLLVADWAPSVRWGAMMLFVFDGGLLSTERERAIVLGADEIASYEFVWPAVLGDRLPARLARRVTNAIAARDAGRTQYLENGEPPWLASGSI
jgi:8-oxo-dGTP diphosphatase